MTTAPGELQVEIDDRIQQDERLLPAIEAASEYFHREAESHPGLVPTNGRLQWSVAEHASGGKRILRTYTEPNGDGKTQRVLRTEFFSDSLFDPVRRDVSMLQLLHEILRWRLETVNERIQNHLHQLDREEQHGNGG